MAAETTSSDRDGLRRTWPQRLLIASVAFAAFASLVAAGLVFVAQQQLEDRQIVSLDTPPGAPTENASIESDDDRELVEPDPETGESAAPVETFPQAEPGTKNILITGADNNACLDPNSRFAAAFGDRQGSGERSDTIMMWRVNAATGQVAVLSFPRDLWVQIDGRSSKGRINEAYQRDNPQRLINTIWQNFGIETDHFVQVDFCAFKELVDAVDGVGVPFDTPVRDGATGLVVEQTGCFTFTGEHALAYVRSRKMEYLTPEGIWERDGTSDLGRISRQQDFIRRVGDELISNAFSPDVVRSLLDVSKEYIVTDDELTIDRILELAGVLQNTDPAEITTYQIEATNQTIQGNAVLVPNVDSQNMIDVIRLFRGEVSLAERPEQDLDLAGGTIAPRAPETTVPVIDPDTTTTTVPDDDSDDDGDESETDSTETGETTPETSTTVGIVETEDIVYGIVPDATESCS
ncbi:LCP family protein [Ilumatobacter nonamiensis]|uniref:LCP family protein n=1 Tax=Ilumatobacter nonamiensis TaxID=467093 RepID=UPI0003484D4C|nr:LCP family protein [Ilumatobacter nonamiensis]